MDRDTSREAVRVAQSPEPGATSFESDLIVRPAAHAAPAGVVNLVYYRAEADCPAHLGPTPLYEILHAVLKPLSRSPGADEGFEAEPIVRAFVILVSDCLLQPACTTSGVRLTSRVQASADGAESIRVASITAPCPDLLVRSVSALAPLIAECGAVVSAFCSSDALTVSLRKSLNRDGELPPRPASGTRAGAA